VRASRSQHWCRILEPHCRIHGRMWEDVVVYPQHVLIRTEDLWDVDKPEGAHGSIAGAFDEALRSWLAVVLCRQGRRSVCMRQARGERVYDVYKLEMYVWYAVGEHRLVVLIKVAFVKYHMVVRRRPRQCRQGPCPRDEVLR